MWQQTKAVEIVDERWNKKRRLKEKYDSSAEYYDDRYESIQRRKFQAIEEELSDANSILDVGCGTGLFINEFSSSADFIVGVDLSTHMLREAKSRDDDLLLISADADNLPFKSCTFDVTVSLTLLQNMPRPLRTMEEMARVTVRGGRIIVTVLEKKHSLDEVEDWLISASLKPLKVESIPRSEGVLGIGEK